MYVCMYVGRKEGRKDGKRYGMFLKRRNAQKYLEFELYPLKSDSHNIIWIACLTIYLSKADLKSQSCNHKEKTQKAYEIAIIYFKMWHAKAEQR